MARNSTPRPATPMTSSGLSTLSARCGGPRMSSPGRRRAAVKVAHGADLLDHSEWTTVGGARRNSEAVRLSVSEGLVGGAGLEPVTSCMSSISAEALCYERGGA